MDGSRGEVKKKRYCSITAVLKSKLFIGVEINGRGGDTSRLSTARVHGTINSISISIVGVGKEGRASIGPRVTWIDSTAPVYGATLMATGSVPEDFRR